MSLRRKRTAQLLRIRLTAILQRAESYWRRKIERNELGEVILKTSFKKRSRYIDFIKAISVTRALQK